MFKLKALLCLVLFLLSTFLLVSCNEPEEPYEEPPMDDAPPTEEEKQDAIDKIVEIFQTSGENVIGDILSQSPGASDALGGYEGEIALDSQMIYLKDGCVVVGDKDKTVLNDAYMLSGTTIAWADGTPANSDWRFIGTMDLVDQEQKAPLREIFEYISELDFNAIQKSDITYKDGFYLVSESFIKSELEKKADSDRKEYLARCLALLELNLGFSVKKSKIIGVDVKLSADSDFFNEIEDENLCKLDARLTYLLNSIGVFPENITFCVDATMKNGGELSAGANVLMLYGSDGAIEAFNVKAEATASDFVLYAADYESEGYRLAVKSNPALALNASFNGQKLLMTDSDVLDFEFSYEVGDELSFEFFDLDGNEISGEGKLTEEETEALMKRAELENVYYEIDLKTENEIKKGVLTVTYKDGKNGGLTRTEHGSVIYASSPNFPLPEEIAFAMKEALANANS